MQCRFFSCSRSARRRGLRGRSACARKISGDMIARLIDIRVAEHEQADALSGCESACIVASSTVTQVPSLPTSARATLKPFSRAKDRRGCSRKRGAEFSGNVSRISRRVFVAQRFHFSINLAAPSALADDAFELVLARRADAHLQSIVGQNFQLVQCYRKSARRGRRTAP